MNTHSRPTTTVQPARKPVLPGDLLDIIGSSREKFTAGGRHFLEIFRNYAGLRPSDRVREILRRNGPEVQQTLFGAWCGREHAVSFQGV